MIKCNRKPQPSFNIVSKSIESSYYVEQWETIYKYGKNSMVSHNDNALLGFTEKCSHLYDERYTTHSVTHTIFYAVYKYLWIRRPTKNHNHVGKNIKLKQKPDHMMDKKSGSLMVCSSSHRHRKINAQLISTHKIMKLRDFCSYQVELSRSEQWSIHSNGYNVGLLGPERSIMDSGGENGIILVAWIQRIIWVLYCIESLESGIPCVISILHLNDGHKWISVLRIGWYLFTARIRITVQG